MSVVFDIGHLVSWNKNLKFDKYIFLNYFDICYDRIFAIILRRHSFYLVQVQILNGWPNIDVNDPVFQGQL